MLSPTYYYILSAVMFSVGVIGVVARKNILIILMSIEIMLNAVNIIFVAAGSFLGDAGGNVFAFMVMTVAAAEAAVGLAIIIAMFRHKESVDISEQNSLKF